MKNFFLLAIALFYSVSVFGQDKINALDSIYTDFDYSPDEPDSVLSARIATIDSEMPLIFNQNVRAFIDMFTINRRDYTRRVIARQNIYFHIFEEALERHNMPDDLKYLTIVESAIRPTAKSRAGALGLWQFMPPTGKMYGLSYDYYIDKRMDPFLATEAACKYLKFLHTMFGDWQMALAAYNCGPGNVRKAIRRSGNKRTFSKIYHYLPKETRGYVPIFMAVNYVFRFHQQHNIFTDKKAPKYDYFEYLTHSYININVLADSLNICTDEVEFLNPQLKHRIIPEKQSFRLRLPLSVKTKFLEKSESYILSSNVPPKMDPLDKVVTIRYKIRKGDNLGKIANKHGIKVSQLKSENSIGRNNVIHTGQYLSITAKTKYVQSSNGVKIKSKKKTPINPKAKTYTVKGGDAVSTIANKFHISIKNLKKWNHIGSRNIIKTGQVLIIADSLPREVKVTSELDNQFHIVKRGDTLWSICQQSGVSIDKLKKINRLSSNNLKIGQKIKL